MLSIEHSKAEYLCGLSAGPYVALTKVFWLDPKLSPEIISCVPPRVDDPVLLAAFPVKETIVGNA